MIVIPAIDLRDGACVQLVGGRYDDERVRIADPVEAARRWKRAGFRQLHVVDLDAATGRGSNAETIRRLLDEPDLEIQVGGGVRSDDGVSELLGRGAARVVVGTRGIEDPDWLERITARHQGRIVLAADVRGTAVTTHGWDRTTDRDVLDLVGDLDRLPLASVLVTAVDREGRLEGTDLDLVRRLRARLSLPLDVAGGIATLDELRRLDDVGCHAAVLGMALYTGALDPSSLTREFAS